ncbi:hypothetical protein ROSA5918_25405 [Roseateles saccharophilus]
MHDAHGPAVGGLSGVAAVEFAEAGRRMALQLAHGPAGHQRIAVHAQEALAPALLQVGQRAIHHMALAGGAQRHVLELGLEVQHLGQRHALQAAALGDGDEIGLGRGRPLAGLGGLPGLHGSAFGQALGGAGQRGLQALAAHGLGQVVDGVELEGAQRMHRMRRHEHDEGHGLAGGGALGQTVGELQAVGAGHLHVQQHDIAAMLAQPGPGLRGGGRFGDDLAARLDDRIDKAAQAQPRQRFVVDDEDLQGAHAYLRAAQCSGWPGLPRSPRAGRPRGRPES